jgi:hypothetical protein
MVLPTEDFSREDKEMAAAAVGKNLNSKIVAEALLKEQAYSAQVPTQDACSSPV